MAEGWNRRRLRVVRRWKKPLRPARPEGKAPRPERPEEKAPRPADLDNPYGPCYTRARSFDQLRGKNKPKP